MLVGGTSKQSVGSKSQAFIGAAEYISPRVSGTFTA
jgi:hypothetical protein